MRFIPTFILDHWIYKSRERATPFELFMRDGELYGRDLCKPDIDADVYRFDAINRKWIKISKEKENC